MLNFFRKIRRKMANENRFIQYSRYAIGEIVLVMVGILLALQVNNWNVEKREQKASLDLLRNFEVTLKKDSTELIKIIGLVGISLETQRTLIASSVDSLHSTFTNKEFKQMAAKVWEGAYSFYPNLGVYNQMLSSNQLDLIQSVAIKEKLIGYYDYKCTRYNKVDIVMDRKYHENFQLFMADDLGLSQFFETNHVPDFNIELIEQFQVECLKLYDLTFGAFGILEELMVDIIDLRALIAEEIMGNT